MQVKESNSTFIRHEPCPGCGSKDNLARYSDGHAFCFSLDCEYMEHSEGEQAEVPDKPQQEYNLLDVEQRALPTRKITDDTCSKWGYGFSTFNGEAVQVATYRDAVGPVAQKIRTKDKNFRWLGDTSKIGLYGEWLWAGGKMVVITEGEIDALSVSQIQGNKWPVCSIPSGCSGAAKAIANSLEWLESFERVIFMFDQDDPGRKAVAECAMMLSPGKARVASLPLKDASECLQAGRSYEVIQAIWGAKEFRPDGVVMGEDIWDVVTQDTYTSSVPYPWGGLNDLTYGIRQGELVTLTSGTGVGKSSVCRELAHHLIRAGHTVGYIALEESVKRSALGLMGVEMNIPLHLNKDDVSSEDLREAFDRTVGSSRAVFYDHFGSLESKNLLSRIRYMVRACGATHIVIDHLSIVISGLEGRDERRMLDTIMTQLRSMVQELDCALILVSHLKRPEGKAHEEGGQTSLSQLRGSAGIGQLSDIVLGFERDQQSKNHKHVTTVRVLKNRYSGDTGVACYLKYDRETGRLGECDCPYDDEETVSPF